MYQCMAHFIPDPGIRHRVCRLRVARVDSHLLWIHVAELRTTMAKPVRPGQADN